MAIFGDMSGMYRITSKALAMLFRLVMVLSLAGYSFSAIDAAMHPTKASPSVEMTDDHSSHQEAGHEAAAQQSDHHGDQHDHGGPEKSKNSCCKDYCGVAAITCSGSSLSHPRVVSIHELADDTSVLGQAPSLHRPPNI